MKDQFRVSLLSGLGNKFCLLSVYAISDEMALPFANNSCQCFNNLTHYAIYVMNWLEIKKIYVVQPTPLLTQNTVSTIVTA